MLLSISFSLEILRSVIVVQWCNAEPPQCIATSLGCAAVLLAFLGVLFVLQLAPPPPSDNSGGTDPKKQAEIDARYQVRVHCPGRY